MSGKDLVLSKPDPSVEQERRLFIGTYKNGTRRPDEKTFALTGNLRDAIERFKVHCERMNLHFIHVRPAVVDLDYQEAHRDENYVEKAYMEVAS